MAATTAGLKKGAAENTGVACWDGASESSLTQALDPPTTECVEAGLMDRREGRAPRQAAGRRLGLMVTTESAYRQRIARVFVGAMETRLHLSQDLRERIHSALQEAVANATLHGNLGLDSALRDDLQGLAKSYQIVETRLAAAQGGRHVIRVDARWTGTTLHIVVRDNGAGFKRSALPSPDEWQAAGHHGSGRGLAILEAFCDSVAFRRHGTAVDLGFRL